MAVTDHGSRIPLDPNEPSSLPKLYKNETQNYTMQSPQSNSLNRKTNRNSENASKPGCEWHDRELLTYFTEDEP